MASIEYQYNGRRIPLYTEDELKMARKHKKRKKVLPERPIQFGMFENSIQDNEIFKPEQIIDSERELNRLHRESKKPFSWNKNSLLNQEIQRKKLELRELIGLPVVRGKDKYINDNFYKYLVKRIVKFDTFRIFNEFDRIIIGTTPEFEIKINDVKGIVNELLNKELNSRERDQKFNNFTEAYRNKWGE